ncbi:hypothetical protein [Flavobacterium sp.]|uniref:hypothetical protein n=1 Tax=Flavobacterium sp. TaxID=239 RepID=UPI0028BF5964|nr:hypothetical protein [Flavobacterium sp.]
MKTKLFALSIICFSFFSCSSDDSGGEDNTPVNFTVPLTTGKYWTYDVTDGTNNFRDSLYISGDTIIASKTYKKFKVKDDVATGFYSSSLRNNGVRESDNKLLLSGDLSVGAGQQLPIDLDLSLSDFIIFKKNAQTGAVLSTKSDSFQETYNGFPVTINYTLTSKGGTSIATFTSPNGDIYTNVKTAIIELNASATTTIPGTTIPITIMDSQDVLVSTQYIADNIGVVYVNTVTSYTINEDAANQLGIPVSGTQTQEEFLDTYN